MNHASFVVGWEKTVKMSNIPLKVALVVSLHCSQIIFMSRKDILLSFSFFIVKYMLTWRELKDTPKAFDDFKSKQQKCMK